MGAKEWAILAFTHPQDIPTLCQFWLYYHQNRDLTNPREYSTSGWDRASMRRCWEFLDDGGRSFSAVIKELDGDLARTICIFYLVLRGLDTIEDDMTIPDHVKQPILRSFHEKTVTPGWTFDKSGPNEKDRQLLVEYNVVVEELNRLDPLSRAIIVDICQKMQTGMADFTHKAATTGSIYLERVEDYDLYCYYVAGIVGEGLSRLLSASGKEQPWLKDQLELSNSAGLLLQKINIIRDIHEDMEQQRFFWPREIWGAPQNGGFTDLKQLATPRFGLRGEDQRLWISSGMVLDALRHAPDSLDYLMVLKNQTVFKFCAIPQAMAMATLELMFMNPRVFEGNVKIRKAHAIKLIMSSTNVREVAYLFRDYARKIHAKASPMDPNFLRLSVACGKIEAWCEHHYPTFVEIKQGKSGAPSSPVYSPMDARMRIVKMDEKRAKERAIIARFGEKAARRTTETNDEGMLSLKVAAFAFVLTIAGGIVLAKKFVSAE